MLQVQLRRGVSSFRFNAQGKCLFRIQLCRGVACLRFSSAGEWPVSVSAPQRNSLFPFPFSIEVHLSTTALQGSCQFPFQLRRGVASFRFSSPRKCNFEARRGDVAACFPCGSARRWARAVSVLHGSAFSDFSPAGEWPVSVTAPQGRGTLRLSSRWKCISTVSSARECPVSVTALLGDSLFPFQVSVEIH